MRKDNILFTVIGILVGLILGFFVANQINRSQTAPTLNQPSKNQPPSSESQGKAAVPAVAEALDNAEKNPDDFAAQIKAGEMFAKISNFEKAIPYFEKASKIKPDDYKTLVMLANSYFDSKKWVDAEQNYEKALAIKSDDIGVRTDFAITFVERENPDYDRAIKELETSLKLDANHQATLFNLAFAYLKKGDVKKAAEIKAKLTPNSELAKKADELISLK
jgi:tetratricopeptide (TPR) repeat protein